MMAGSPLVDMRWRNQAVRQSMVAKIEDAIMACGSPTTKNAMEMEMQLFSKAKSKEEYMGFVARLILHIKEMGSKKQIQHPTQGRIQSTSENSRASEPCNDLAKKRKQVDGQPGEGSANKMSRTTDCLVSPITTSDVFVRLLVAQMNEMCQEDQDAFKIGCLESIHKIKESRKAKIAEATQQRIKTEIGVEDTN